METNEINKPIKEFKAGFVKASIWENDLKLENGEVVKVNSLNLVKTIKDSQVNSCTISNIGLESGRYSMGVSITNTEGRSSEIHSSTDNTASPPAVWYVFWILD